VLAIHFEYGKNVIPLEWQKGKPIVFESCLATIGAAFFGATASVVALFYFSERSEK